jgi:glutaredoxin
MYASQTQRIGNKRRTIMSEIRVFTTPTCSYCHKVKDWFREQGCEFTELDITKDVQALREWRALSGGIGVPVTAYGNDLIVGFDPGRLSQLQTCVENSSKPDPSMLPDDAA